jgi:cytoskeletal protein RodZ/TfoX/Sxy family transcriptional regulator of competence genes
MNFPKKGPELKLSEVKVPDFVYDLYYDLKERHLLPLVALLAISIVVVPIALSRTTGSSAEEEAPVATPSVAGGEASTLTVARSAPGLREYRRRLRHARALDPFRAASEAAAASEASATASSSEVPVAPEVTEPGSYAPVEAPVESAPPVSYPSEFEATGTTTVTKTQTKYASQTVDVRIVTVPQGQGGEPPKSAKPSDEVRRGLPELTMLPSRESPAAVFMGTSADGKKALFLVSSDVQSIFGDGRCIVGSATCQLLALERGVPETFVYGKQAKTYRIEILKIDQQLTDKPRRAALGEEHGEGADTKSDEAPEGGAGRISGAQPR